MKRKVAILLEQEIIRPAKTFRELSFTLVNTSFKNCQVSISSLSH
jgi:hypothetical protein